MNRSTIYRMSFGALMAAVLCVLGPLSIPIGPVPVSLGVFVVCLAAWLLDTPTALASVGVYLLLGAAGLPVFTGFAGGLAKLAGPTGGYLIGYLAIVLAACPVKNACGGRVVPTAAALAFGVAVCYAFGTVWFMHLTGNGLTRSLALCVWPFIPFDLGKIAAATLIGKPVREALRKANLSEDAA